MSVLHQKKEKKRKGGTPFKIAVKQTTIVWAHEVKRLPYNI